MATKSPTQKTLGWFRSLGCPCAITEHWNSFTKIRQDLFGFCDVLVLADHIVAVQTTSDNNHAARRTKINGIEAARSWLLAGGKIAVMSWKPGGKVDGMTPRIEEAKLEGINLDLSWVSHEGNSFSWFLTVPF